MTKYEARQKARAEICKEIEMRLGLESPDWVDEEVADVYCEECWRIADRIRAMYGIPDHDYLKGIHESTHTQS